MVFLFILQLQWKISSSLKPEVQTAQENLYFSTFIAGMLSWLRGLHFTLVFLISVTINTTFLPQVHIIVLH